MLDVNVLGTFIVNGAVADAINRPLNHPDGTDKHAPFWTSDEERGVIVNFASAAARPYARCLAYGPTKTATIGITQGGSEVGRVLKYSHERLSWSFGYSSSLHISL